MRESQNDVREFHVKHGFPVDLEPGEDSKIDMVRVHLIAEELGELAEAIAERSRVKIADALADLLYVVLGTAVTYDVPASAVFDEVHRSNMTKAVRRPDDIRLRDKGISYVPADIAAVLEEYDRRTEVAIDEEMSDERKPIRRRSFTYVLEFFREDTSNWYSQYVEHWGGKAVRDGCGRSIKRTYAGPADRPWQVVVYDGTYTVRGNSPSDLKRQLITGPFRNLPRSLTNKTFNILSANWGTAVAVEV